MVEEMLITLDRYVPRQLLSLSLSSPANMERSATSSLADDSTLWGVNGLGLDQRTLLRE